MKSATQSSWFAPRLREAIIGREGMSVRQLARDWRPDVNEETSRRSLNRYLHDGVVPGEAIRSELAAVLGVPLEHFLVGGPDDPNPFPGAA